MKNAVSCYVMKCGSSKNRRFGKTSVLTSVTRRNIAEDSLLCWKHLFHTWNLALKPILRIKKSLWYRPSVCMSIFMPVYPITSAWNVEHLGKQKFVCMSVCVLRVTARQRSGKHYLAETNTHVAIQESLDESFTVRFLWYKTKEMIIRTHKSPFLQIEASLNSALPRIYLALFG
jgi:hypothetical protein